MKWLYPNISDMHSTLLATYHSLPRTMDSRKRSITSNDDADAKSGVHKEWDDSSCPICMDHPHNAVLLICTSHDKGCRSYICNTSYRHSNCLDRFKKPLAEAQPSEIGTEDKLKNGPGLKCPLCRGPILGWKVEEEARKYLNLKPRACSRELCSFSGNYRELRGHARRVHPAARPADVDPSRQRAWRRLEDQREYNDIVSAISSAVPGAVVVGDYMIEGGGGRQAVAGERDHHRGGAGEGGARWLSTLVLFQMIGSLDGGEGRGGRSRGGQRNRHGGGAPSSRRRYLWGENLLGIRDDGDEEDDEEDDEEGEDDEVDLNMLSDIGQPRRRRRRRLMRDPSLDNDEEEDMGF